MTAHPLRDESGGQLKGWPGGEYRSPGGAIDPVFRRARSGEQPVAIVRRAPGAGRWIYCKYCYGHTLPLALDESIKGVAPTRMLICSRCGAGLTSPVVRH